MFLQGYQPQTLVVMLIQGRAVEPWQVCCSWTTCRTASVVPTVTRSQSSSQSVGHVISTSTHCSSRLPYRMASMTMTTTVFYATDCQWYLWWWTDCQLQTGVCVCNLFWNQGKCHVWWYCVWQQVHCGIYEMRWCDVRNNKNLLFRLCNYAHIMYAGRYWTEAHQFSWTFTLFR
jgi:hypothetical protein